MCSSSFDSAECVWETDSQQRREWEKRDNNECSCHMSSLMCGVLPLTSIHDDSHVNLHLQAFPELSLRQPGHLSHGHHSIIQQCQLNPCMCVYVHLCSNVHLWEKSANIERWGHTEVTFPLLNSQKDIAFWYLCHTPLTPPHVWYRLGPCLAPVSWTTSAMKTMSSTTALSFSAWTCIFLGISIQRQRGRTWKGSRAELSTLSWQQPGGHSYSEVASLDPWAVLLLPELSCALEKVVESIAASEYCCLVVRGICKNSESLYKLLKRTK